MWCSYCGIETADGDTECDRCRQWWADNPPPVGGFNITPTDDAGRLVVTVRFDALRSRPATLVEQSLIATIDSLRLEIEGLYRELGRADL